MGKRAAAVDLPGMIEEAVRRLRRAGWQAEAVSLAAGRHERVFGWLDIVALDPDQRCLLGICAAGPAGDEEDVLTAIRSSPAVRGWLLSGGQVEGWRRGVMTRPRGAGESHRQPIRLASLTHPGPPAPAMSWQDAGLPGEGPRERGRGQ